MFSHQILKDTLDIDAPIGEVFKSSVEEAVSAVEEPTVDLARQVSKTLVKS